MFLTTGLALPAAGLASSVQNAPSAPKEKAPSAPKLSFRTLGKTGIKVTTLGFGCMLTSDGSVIEKAADLGVNYFDTARGYGGGNNERMVGAALKSRRKQLYISSKSHVRTKDAAAEELNTSLRELGTDYIDIWCLHALGKPEELTPELLEVQQAAKKAGKIRFAGVSVHANHSVMIPAVIRSGVVDVLIVSYNFAMDPAIEEGMDKLAEAGIGVIAMKVMAGGSRRRGGEQAAAILKREGAMLAALKWVVKNPKVHTTIPSMVDMDQLEDNMKAMNVAFSEADKQTLTAHLDRISPIYCRTCGHCQGTCAKGLPVSDMLRILTYADGYGQFPLARERFSELPETVASVRCGDCASCSVKCKFGVHVPERLARAQELFA